MTQITQEEREAKIRQLLADAQRQPPKEHEIMRLPETRGEPVHAHVVSMSVDDVLLNPNSHRVRSQLEDDVEWASLRQDPFGEEAQRLIQRHVVEARNADDFAALSESLIREGQTDPGVLTTKGVLVNANTRVAALRQLDDPARRYIRVAVLPETFDPDEISLLELRLQMQRELKVAYSLTNELIFIDELASKRRFSNVQIAREMRIHPESERKGTAEVERRLRMLDLIRRMQQIPSERLKLTFFDTLSLQQLRDLLSDYDSAIDRSEPEAEALLRGFLLSTAAGVVSVHLIRKVDADFVDEYMVPQLEDDELIGPWTEHLISPSARTDPAGLDLLAPGDEDGDDRADVVSLIDILTAHDRRVDVPGTSIVLDRNDVADAVNSAIRSGIAEKQRERRSENQLEAPRDLLRKATKQIQECAGAVQRLSDNPDFDTAKQKALESNYNKLTRALRKLESDLKKAGIVDG